MSIFKNIDFEKFLEDGASSSAEVNDFLAKFIFQLNEKIVNLSDNKNNFLIKKQNDEAELENHLYTILNKIIQEKKTQLKEELDKDYAELSESVLLAIDQANNIRSRLENELTECQQVISNQDSNNNNLKNDYDDEFTEDDALMINDSVNEFSLEPLSKNNAITKLKTIFKNIETIMSEKLLVDNFLEDSGTEIIYDKIKFIKCSPDLNSICFGHFYKETNLSIGSTPSIFSSINQLDHTKFQIDTPNGISLSENLSFRKSENCLIQFYCPFDGNTPKNKKEQLHLCLTVDIFDPKNKVVSFCLKEKITSTKRIIRVCFTPCISGVYKLSIKFKNIDIENSPFHFMVLSNSNSTAAASASSIKSPVTNIQRSIADKLESSLIEAPVSPTVPIGNHFGMSISQGRGRLIKEMKEKKGNQSKNIELTIANSQKRKSPHRELNNNIKNDADVLMFADEEEDDDSIKEISSKLKKWVQIDETSSQVLNYPDQSISDLMRLKVKVNDTKFQSLSAAEVVSNPFTGCNILSNHLRKYTNQNPNGLVRLIEDKIPNLKAKFQCKYESCYYPIGVRACKIRNWLIVCDSGNDTVKVFERTTGELLHQIKAEDEFTFKRPSAVLINYENNTEIYVKDDKEILVFDLENDFKFVRKFGFKILRRPYGLAFNSRGELVLVDADLRNPVIHTFEKNTGKLLNSVPYEPVNPKHAQTGVLIQNFSTKTKTLSTDLIPFERTKVRFIYCIQDKLYASDLGRSIIFKTSLNGKTELAFGFQGKKHGEMNEPSGIHVDSDSQAILVGDSKNDRLQIYDANGKHRCDIEFEDEKIVRPSDIHVDSDGYLYVSCFIQHCVKKFKLVSE